MATKKWEEKKARVFALYFEEWSRRQLEEQRVAESQTHDAATVERDSDGNIVVAECKVSVWDVDHVVASNVGRLMGERRSAHVPSIERPFATRAAQFFELAYSRKTYETVFAQAIEDVRQEINEDLAAGRLSRVRLVELRGWWTLGRLVMVQLASGLIDTVSAIRRLIG
jgi:hypothetical protein